MHLQTNTLSTTPLSLLEAAQLRLLKASELSIRRFGVHLQLTLPDECSHLNVKVCRAFPLSNPQRFWSFLTQHNEEIGILLDPTELPLEARSILQEYLDKRYFTPKILRVLKMKDWFGTVDWHVETDRGRCRFTTRELRSNALQPTAGRYVLTDTDGNRYEIEHLSALDPISRRAFMEKL